LDYLFFSKLHSDDFEIFYNDDEGDQIPLSCDFDLDNKLKAEKDKDTIKITIIPSKGPYKVINSKNSEKASLL